MKILIPIVLCFLIGYYLGSLKHKSDSKPNNQKPDTVYIDKPFVPEEPFDEPKEPELIYVHTLDTIEILKQFPANGVIHCYSYTKESAKEFLKMGYYFGIGGVLTFKNAKKLKEAVMEIPMDRILLETDSPYLAPEPNRGKRNSSLNIPYVVKELAQLKGITEEEVINITTENTKRLFHLV